ncbi:hypothetical protein BFG07_08480 [Kosakonia cowanii]|nr:hypothetical protein BFG07_08480 [Kosakonia cowanii]
MDKGLIVIIKCLVTAFLLPPLGLMFLLLFSNLPQHIQLLVFLVLLILVSFLFLRPLVHGLLDRIASHIGRS